jgi:hypothetical protein
MYVYITLSHIHTKYLFHSNKEKTLRFIEKYKIRKTHIS